MKLLVVFLGLFLVTHMTYSAETSSETSYEYCQNTTDKLFPIAKIEGKEMPPLFTISPSGTLVASPDVHMHTYTSTAAQDKQEYRFDVLEPSSRRVRRRLSRANLNISDLKYSFVVQRDTKGRIKSIKLKSSQEDGKDSTELQLTYSKENCVPSQLITSDLQGEKQIAIDTVVCKHVVENERALLRMMKEGKSCIDKLNKSYVDGSSRIKNLLKRLKNDSREIENYSKSNMIQTLENLESKTQLLSKKLGKYIGTEEDQESVRFGYSEMLGNCFRNLDDKMLKQNRVFNSDGEIRREDRPVAAPAGEEATEVEES